MGKRLNNTVHVYVPEIGDYVIYGPDDEVPAEHAELIGDHAWVDDSDDDGDTGRESGVEPPRSGKGSGQKAWAEFATESGHGDGVDDMSRDEIVSMLVDAGVVAE